MTVKDVATEVLAESLLAVQDLRRKYLDQPMETAYGKRRHVDYSSCPLCQLAAEIGGEEIVLFDGSGCQYCPWGFIEGVVAETFLCFSAGYDGVPRPDRLARIDRWEEAINAEIATREAKP
jgi:hypothetical protein